MNTNTNHYKERVRNYIINNINEIEENNTDKKKLVYLLHTFDVEFNYANNKQRIPNLQNRLADWLNGSPYAISTPTYYYDMIEDTKQIHNTEVLTEKETEIICNNFYNHIALHILKYAEKLEIKLTNLY
tara:strand:- start:4561 stop:4947 length:387 start_codon:yes stop_codon:yes gene_type:complete